MIYNKTYREAFTATYYNAMQLLVQLPHARAVALRYVHQSFAQDFRNEWRFKADYRQGCLDGTTRAILDSAAR